MSEVQVSSYWPLRSDKSGSAVATVGSVVAENVQPAGHPVDDKLPVAANASEQDGVVTASFAVPVHVARGPEIITSNSTADSAV